MVLWTQHSGGTLLPSSLGNLKMGLFGKKTSVGLDIGSGFVKLVEVDHSGDQPEVSRVAIEPLLPDAIVEGEVMDPGLVADTIRNLFESPVLTGRF